MNKTIIIGILALVLVGGGVIYAVNNNSNVEPNTDDTITPNPPPAGGPTPTPTPTPNPVPGQPVATTDTIVSPTASTAIMNGRVNPNGAITSYWFEYGTSANLGYITSFQSASDSSSRNVSVSLSNLSPATKYFFRLNAQNQYGTVNGAILNFTTNGPAATTTIDVNLPIHGTTPGSNW